CAHCFAPKTNDSYTRFCTECGLPWQKLTHNPPNNYPTNICTNCKSTIPFNSNLCVVCETPASITRNGGSITHPHVEQNFADGSLLV
ncbi:unnamed protein product, partial [Rotaria sordida]